MKREYIRERTKSTQRERVRDAHRDRKRDRERWREIQEEREKIMSFCFILLNAPCRGGDGDLETLPWTAAPTTVAPD